MAAARSSERSKSRTGGHGGQGDLLGGGGLYKHRPHATVLYIFPA